jgi:CDP-glycerol glycerophosphotransferase (TagB/SpsB family)
MLAMSLPIDTVLVVKEHPWMVGKRSSGAYQKMLDIPRVRFVDPALEARMLIKHADLVAVVTGSVALEAAMLGKPVITFGDCPYNLLPDAMVRRCTDPRHLQTIIRDAIADHQSDEAALLAYVTAVFESSVSVNLYSVLLRKANVHAERNAAYIEEIENLAEYLVILLANKVETPATHPDSARW